MMKAAFYTLGCKVNQYETEAVAQEFMRHGYLLVSEEDSADASEEVKKGRLTRQERKAQREAEKAAKRAAKGK